MAERERFELSVGVYPLHSLSRRAPSADSDTSPKSDKNMALRGAKVPSLQQRRRMMDQAGNFVKRHVACRIISNG
jgi:hypothetical protein